MGFFSNMFAMAQAEAEKVMNQGAPQSEPKAEPPTRWEKAVVGLSGIVKQVSKIDPDGVDVYCFGGDEDEDVYRNIKDIKGLEGMVTAKEPSGECKMGAVLDDILNEAFERGFDASRPCSILVLTAGKPDDSDDLTAAIEAAGQKINESGEDSPLTITFVQVGDDVDAETYLKYLDDSLATTNAEGDPIDLVDTIKDEEIKTAMAELQENGSGTGGALFGAFAGAAMGVGGMYLYSQMNAKKRTEGWNGSWKVTFEGEEVAVLTVKDDMAGNLELEGFIPEDDDDEGKTTGTYMDGEDGSGYSINFVERGTGDTIHGTVEDEHNIAWSDGTHWEEVPPDGSSWAAYLGAATVGAAAGGATGYLLQKKFFNKASNKVPSDYIIVLDRSSKMAVPDTGN